jgi:diaphanous 2
VATIERKFPELLTFSEDLAHVDRAARVSVETVQKTLRQMSANIQNLETDLNNMKQPQGDDDKFSEVMGVSFTGMSLLLSLWQLGLNLTLCRSYLNLYCLGRKTAFFPVVI